MDPELKSLLEENLRVAKDNNRLLRRARHARWFGVLWTIVVWVIVLGGPVYLYYTYQSQFTPAHIQELIMKYATGK